MARIKSGLACPLCDAAGTESNLFVEAGGGGARMMCETGDASHSWTDQGVLNNLRPRKLAIAPRPDAVQKDHAEVKLMVPAGVKAALEGKYGDRLSVSLTSLLQAAAEPEMMVLSASDLARIEERLGSKPKSSSELFGILFALGEDVKASRNDFERLQRRVHVSSGKVGAGTVVDLGDWVSKAVAKAADSGVTLEEYLSKYLRDSLENDWVS